MAIGKFESMHLGHQALIHKAREEAKMLNLPTVVMSFCPHPFTVLGNREYRPLFTTLQILRVIEEKCPVDYFLRFPFTEQLAKTPPEEFCRILFGELSAKALFVGRGYRFGANRAGTADTLKSEAARYGAKVTVVEVEKLGQAQISTSIIRRLISEGSFAEASRLLGFGYPLD